MSGLELNKLAAGILLAGLIAMVVGKVSNVLYHPETNPEKRGYEIAVEDSGGATETASAEEEAPEDIMALMAEADPAAGEALIKRCVSCHTFDSGGANKVGPNMWGIFGADIASNSTFSYSDALVAVEGSWDENKLSAFLKKPKKFAPGTKMAFAGLKKDKQRADLIAYLKSLK